MIQVSYFPAFYQVWNNIGEHMMFFNHPVKFALVRVLLYCA